MRNDSSILVRHVIAEIAKVLVLTTTVMVIVVAFGAVIRPLAQNLLGPFGVAKYVALATVPMLQFALPFAGGFAATLVTHRMVSDNEFLAMSVSGLSYRSIFRPHVVLGVALAIIMAAIILGISLIIAAAILGYLLVNTLKEPGNMNPESAAFAASARLPGMHEVLGWVGIEWPRTPLNAAFLLALAAAFR